MNIEFSGRAGGFDVYLAKQPWTA